MILSSIEYSAELGTKYDFGRYDFGMKYDSGRYDSGKYDFDTS